MPRPDQRFDTAAAAWVGPPSNLSSAVTYLASIPMDLVQAYAYPDPLPMVRLASPRGDVVRGRLIVHTDSLWYVARTGGRIAALPDRQVASAEITSQQPEKHRTLGALLRDLFGW